MKHAMLLSALVFILFSSCHNKVSEPDAVQKTAPEVHYVNPQIKTINDYIELNGVSIFLQKEVIRSTVTGYITEVYSNIGEHVSQNQKLFAVKTSEAYALHPNSDTAMFSHPIIIKSNKSGVLSVLNSQQGSYIQLGDVLAEIAEPQNLVIQINVPYEYHTLIRLGKACEVILTDGNRIQGSVFRIMPVVDEMSQTQTVFLKLNSFNELPENLNVRVEILRSTKQNVLTIPKTALLTNETQDKFWVMKIINDTLAVEVPVQKGIENDLEIEIISPPLLLTDKIITTGAYGLPDSSVIKTVK
ncbi:MAG: efflux RND transporter periplasmic adaptor subunit [Bacteroidota bacterium]